MEKSNQPVVYLPLSGPRSIRVLVLQPALRRVDPIRCSFFEVSLDDDSDTNSYEAISYTWGAPSGTKPVLCDGYIVLVTPNCEQALMHLRLPTRPRRIWIDAICINQQSISEKNIQVPMMGDIYRHASRTIIWLGPDIDHDLSEVLRHASRYGSLINKFGRRGQRLLEICIGYGIVDQKDRANIARLLSNQWFSRLWTIQEFLSSKSCIFLLGETECTSNNLLSYFGAGMEWYFSESRPDLDHFQLRKELAKAKFRAASSVHHAVRFNACMQLLIKLISLNNCADPRDKVYGIVAHMKRLFPDLQIPAVDYGRPLEEVYESFTRSIMAATGSPWVLQLINPASRTDTDNRANMPSWVLDLRDPLCINSGAFWELSGNAIQAQRRTPGKLYVRGKKIGEVARVSSKMPRWVPRPDRGFNAQDLDAARAECLREWMAFATALDLDEDIVAASPYRFFRDANGNRGSKTKGSANTCSGPHVCAIRRFTEQLDYLRQTYGLADGNITVGDRPKIDSQPKDKKWPLTRTARAIKRNWKMATTFRTKADRHRDGRMLLLESGGYLGECEGDARAGDKIYCLAGAAFILRETRTDNEFALVGRMEVQWRWHWPRESNWHRNIEMVAETELIDIVLV